MELFTQEGGALLARYAHYVAGVTWIGLLYYFNYVQGPAFAGFAPEARTEATAKLVPRALWWFRWAALVTVISGFFSSCQSSAVMYQSPCMRATGR